MPFCPRCSKPLLPYAKYCRRCGYPVPRPPQPIRACKRSHHPFAGVLAVIISLSLFSSLMRSTTLSPLHPVIAPHSVRWHDSTRTHGSDRPPAWVSAHHRPTCPESTKWFLPPHATQYNRTEPYYRPFIVLPRSKPDRERDDAGHASESNH